MAAALIFEETPEFAKDFKRLSKRFRTLTEDFARLKKMAIALYHLQGIDSRACLPIPHASNERFAAYKVKKFACRSLKGGANSGLRVIYLYEQAVARVLFLEIYYKGDQNLEDRERINRYLG